MRSVIIKTDKLDPVVIMNWVRINKIKYKYVDARETPNIGITQVRYTIDSDVDADLLEDKFKRFM